MRRRTGREGGTVIGVADDQRDGQWPFPLRDIWWPDTNEPVVVLKSTELKDIVCPYCGGGGLAYLVDLTPDGPGTESEVQCLDCFALWDGRFKAVDAPRWAL